MKIIFTEIRETIGKNIDEMERLETLMQAVTELKKMGKEDAEEDEKEKTEEGSEKDDANPPESCLSDLWQR